jgi:NTP pyrophosphatase (non-canonical NTP hydrolase)
LNADIRKARVVNAEVRCAGGGISRVPLQCGLRAHVGRAGGAWEQFHTPKNLAMARAGEAGELLGELQWLTAGEAAPVMEHPKAAARMRSELAYVTIYLVRLADLLGVDLIEAARTKLAESERRYDVETYRGSRRKAPPMS